MKKIILLVLALVLVLSFVACDKKEETPDAPAVDGTTDNNTDAGEEKPEEKTWGDATCEEIVNTMLSQLEIQLMMPVLQTITPETNLMTGLCNDAETGTGGIDFADAAVYTPMITAQRFDLAVIRVKEGTDVAAYVKDLETRNANEQWLCATPPDFVKVVALGDVVLYLSIDKTLTDGDAIVNAFLNPIDIVAPSTGEEFVEDDVVEEPTDDETVEGGEVVELA